MTSFGHQAHAQRVVEYYEHTRFDYRAAWTGPENLAFHFGYHDGEVRTHQEALANSNRVLADLAGVRPGHRVFDAGCALGGSSLWLARHRGTTGVGVTLVPDQVARAQEEARARGLADRVEFRLADYCRAPFPDGSFDVVWALESLCHSPVKADFYAEAFRLLRPGGRLVVAEYVRTARKLRPPVEQVVAQWLDGWAMPDLDTAEEHANNATAAGFEGVVVRDLTWMTRPSLRRLFLRSCVVWPAHATLHRLGVRTRPQDGNVRASIAQFRALTAGAWFYGVLTATRP